MRATVCVVLCALQTQQLRRRRRSPSVFAAPRVTQGLGGQRLEGYDRGFVCLPQSRQITCMRRRQQRAACGITKTTRAVARAQPFVPFAPRPATLKYTSQAYSTSCCQHISSAASFWRLPQQGFFAVLCHQIVCVCPPRCCMPSSHQQATTHLERFINRPSSYLSGARSIDACVFCSVRLLERRSGRCLRTGSNR